MAQNITLMGASYSDVPSVLLPKTGGGTASFTDVTDTTAIAADVAQGKYFYTADGTKTAGSYVAPTPRTASDVTVSGATVTIPSGAYASQVQKSVASGTAGTPTATKGAVSNHAVSVTPSVTNTTGYITGSTISGTAVSVSASELVSGTKSITENGTADVTNYASVDVNVSGGGSPVIQSLSVTQNGTYIAPTGVDGYSPVTVNVSGGSASNVVTGTFKGTTTGTAMDVTLNYSGSGHPIAVMVYPSDGPYKSGGTFYNLIQRYACNYWIAIKSNMSTSPAYSGGTTDKYCGYQYRKNSTSSSTTYTGTAFTDGSVADDIGAVTNNGNGIVRLRSKTKMSVYIADTSYGFAANIEYKYWVMYSS